MFKFIKEFLDDIQTFWGEEVEREKIRSAQPQKKYSSTERTTIPETPKWKISAYSYNCWGCNKEERIHIDPQPTKEELSEFWRRWGKEPRKILFLGDGSYCIKNFCPECQNNITEAVDSGTLNQFQFGFLASEVAATLRDSEENKENFKV